MTDAEYEHTKARISDLAEHWRGILGLKGWQIVDNYYRDALDFAHETGSAHRVAACVRSDWPYMCASFSWNVAGMFSDGADEIENTVVHEHAHVLVCEMRDPETKAVTDHEERVVTMVANALLWTRDAAMKREIDDGP